MIQAISGTRSTAYAAPRTPVSAAEAQEPPQAERAEALRGTSEAVEAAANPNLGRRISLLA